MYVPAAFRDESLPSLHAFIRDNGFATVVSRVEGELFASHVPLLLDAERGANGTLLGHVARASPHWRVFAGNGAEAGEEALAIFHGPHTYVSPRWYVAETAVPTWNYTAVHASGHPRLVEDPAVVRVLLARLARQYEGDGEGRWDPDAMPEGYVDGLARAIVAFELPIARLEGKRKLSQNRPEEDRRGVIAALEAGGDFQGRAVAALMRVGLPEA